MLKSLTLRSFVARPRAAVSTSRARYSTGKVYERVDKDVLKTLQEDHAVLLNEFNTGIGAPKEIRADLAATTNQLVSDYQKLYDDLNKNGSTWTKYPAEFYDLPPAQQAARIAYLKTLTDSCAQGLEKHGNEAFSPGIARLAALSNASTAEQLPPIRVCVTGASGQLGYALVFRIASGAMFGPNQPVILSLLELPQAMNSLNGVVMELKDCAFPTLAGIIATDNAEVAFSQVDYACLVGASPRSKGMERKDLLLKNASIFAAQGKALNARAKGAATRVVVVGNPANTNALIASHNAPAIPRENFSAMMRLDHNRALTQLAEYTKSRVNDIERFVVWGNHSATQFPDISHASIKGKHATTVITDKNWLKSTFTPAVQERGAEIIKARGVSSAASAASACVDAVADIHFGTFGRWTSAGVISDGSYGVTKGLFYGFPVVYNNKEWDIVRDLPIDEEAAIAMERTHQELLQERDAVASYLVR